MAWWDFNLNNTILRLSVIQRVTEKLEQLAKKTFSALGEDDTGVLRIKPNTTGFQRWSGSEWVDVVFGLEHGGTGASTLAAARTALEISETGGSGSGTAVGTEIFSRELTVSTDAAVLIDQIREIDETSYEFQVTEVNLPSLAVAIGNYSEGAVAFKILNSAGLERIIGFISNAEETVINNFSFVVLTVSPFLGDSVIDRNSVPSLGVAGEVVTLKLYRRNAAALDLSKPNTIQLEFVDLRTEAKKLAWRDALLVAGATATKLNPFDVANESNVDSATRRAVAQSISFANPDNWQNIGTYQKRLTANLAAGRFAAAGNSVLIHWTNSNAQDQESLIKALLVREKIIITTTSGAFAGILRADTIVHDNGNNRTTLTQTSGNATLVGLSDNTDYGIYANYYYRRLVRGDLDSDIIGSTQIEGPIAPGKLGIGGDSEETNRFLREDGTFALPFEAEIQDSSQFERLRGPTAFSTGSAVLIGAGKSKIRFTGITITTGTGGGDAYFAGQAHCLTSDQNQQSALDPGLFSHLEEVDQTTGNLSSGIWVVIINIGDDRNGIGNKRIRAVE